jgi:predicted negative regulator of RcsB-dependent stress response
MQEFETEEQQIQALKKWWSENATSLILGVGVGVSALWGWNYYVDTANEHRIAASDIYVAVVKQVEENNVNDEGVKKVEELVNEYADTPYAALSALNLATYEFNRGNVDEAVSRLKWVDKNAQEEEIRHIARLRLASIFISQKKYDDAQGWLSLEHPAAFNARYEELKGDVFVAMGNLEQARVAYDKAIEQSSQPNRWLKLKRQDLGSSELKKSAMVEPAA